VPDVGYTQGLNMIVRMLLEVFDGDEESAFHALCGLGHGVGDMWKDGLELLEFCLYAMERVLERQLPVLSKHLKDKGVGTAFFATKWFLTVYVRAREQGAGFNF
jgi:hypothetical protein